MEAFAQLELGSTSAYLQPPEDALKLHELPLNRLALVVGQLGAEGMLDLFRVSHTTQRLVFSHACGVRLKERASMHAPPKGLTNPTCLITPKPQSCAPVRFVQ